MSATRGRRRKEKAARTPEPTGEWSLTCNVFSPGGERGECRKAPVQIIRRAPHLQARQKGPPLPHLREDRLVQLQPQRRSLVLRPREQRRGLRQQAGVGHLLPQPRRRALFATVGGRPPLQKAPPGNPARPPRSTSRRLRAAHQALTRREPPGRIDRGRARPRLTRLHRGGLL